MISFLIEMRLFISIPITLNDSFESFDKRFTKVDSHHISLAYFDDVTQQDISYIKEKLIRLHQKSFSIRTQDHFAFLPSTKNIRAIYIPI